MKRIHIGKLVGGLVLAAAGLHSCALLDTRTTPHAEPSQVEVKIIAFNDFHGNLEPPNLAVAAPSGEDNAPIWVPAGGAAYLASAITYLKSLNPNHAVVSAGDLIGGSPLVSALFLDEPTIEAINRIKIDFNAVGNHEFDKGQAELLRMQNGGCEKHTSREPCALNKSFPGANFSFLAANTVKADGSTFFPPTGIKEFGSGVSKVRIGFIGLTLKNTSGIVPPDVVEGLQFKDEAQTANALIPALKEQGADGIVVVVHEGGKTTGLYNDKSCPNLTGDIRPILDRLDPAVDVVISGHTHNAYVCDYGRMNPARPFLLTSAGQYGTLVTDISLVIDTVTRKVVAKTADNVIVQGEPSIKAAGVIALTHQYRQFPKDPAVDQLVTKYADASRSIAQRVVATLREPLRRRTAASGESALGNLIADAQLAATRDPTKGGAQIAFMNPGGLRADLGSSPDGEHITFAQLFNVQPFGNSLVVKRFTGTQLRALLEQQFDSGTNTVASPRILSPSAGFSYTYDLTRPAGERISNMQLHGKPVRDGSTWHVTMNSFLASGGDNFTVFRQGVNVTGGALDIEALENYLKVQSPVSSPKTDRISRLD